MSSNGNMSPSTRRAWIEIVSVSGFSGAELVALHPEGVDRNPGTMPVVDGDIDVALHPEGVDRNCGYHFNTGSRVVALHPEGVDRNPQKKPDLDNIMVALHPEGVDRNYAIISRCGATCKVALHPEGVDRNVI